MRSGDGVERRGRDDGSGAAPRLARVTYLPGAEPADASASATAGLDHTADPPVSPEVGPTEAASARASARAERRAENVSIAALTRRGQSRRELEKTLVSRELTADVVESELARLEGVGLIDDAALAETIVRTQHERKGLGRSALVAELRRRLIDQHHIEAALDQLDDDDESEKAAELAERRARQLTSLDRETATRRLTGYLMRKGYSSSVVRGAVDAALAGHGHGRGSTPGAVRFR